MLTVNLHALHGCSLIIKSESLSTVIFSILSTLAFINQETNSISDLKKFNFFFLGVMLKYYGLTSRLDYLLLY